MAKEEIKREMIKHFQLNENENTAYQNLLDAIKAVVGGRKEENSALKSKKKANSPKSKQKKENNKDQNGS